MTSKSSKTSNDILVDRAIIRAAITSDKIEKLITKADKNSQNRTTITGDTLSDLQSDLSLIILSLDEIKY